jgi:hypothetical protein
MGTRSKRMAPGSPAMSTRSKRRLSLWVWTLSHFMYLWNLPSVWTLWTLFMCEPICELFVNSFMREPIVRNLWILI